MTGVTGIGTTFNLPNYHGELFALTPADTPLLSMAGGLGGGKQATSTEFEWQAYDLREPSSRPRLEGADAPAPEERKRENMKNVVQIFHETVATSYTKQAAVGQFAGPQAAPFHTPDGLGVGNPVVNEHVWQVQQALIQIARDVNYTFWHSKKVVPTDNTIPRQTGGLLSVLTTNRSFASDDAPEVAASTSGSTVTSNAHGLADGDRVVFTDLDAATNIRADRAYMVSGQTTNTFKVSESAGGPVLALGNANVKYVRVSGAGSAVITVDLVNAFLQGIFDNGGLVQGDTRTLFVPSIQKTLITKAYATAYGSKNGVIGLSTGHVVGGVAVDQIVTDFGTLNLVVERSLPKDAIAACSMEQIDPVFLAKPGNGVLYEEPLAKTGSADKSQIYGEIGLKYGNERAHGVMRGLAVVAPKEESTSPEQSGG